MLLSGFFYWFFWVLGVAFASLLALVLIGGFIAGFIQAIKNDKVLKEKKEPSAGKIAKIGVRLIKALEKSFPVLGKDAAIELLKEVHDFYIEDEDDFLDECEERAMELDTLTLKRLRHGERFACEYGKPESDYKCLCETECISGIDKRYACPLWNECSECTYLSSVDPEEN